MNKNYKLLISSLICGLILWNSGFASHVTEHNHPISVLNNLSLLSETPATALHLGQHIQLGAYTMQITELQEAKGQAAKGSGDIYLPFLNEKLAVRFEDISVNVLGNLMAGEIISINAQGDKPTFRSPEKEVLQYLKFSNEKGKLPRLLTPILEAKGIDFGGHEMILTHLVFTKENTRYDAMLMVQNPDGRVTTFSHSNLLVDEEEMNFCNQTFSLDGGDQSITDPILPIIIKGFNPDAAPGSAEQGTYVSFTCDGLDNFHLSGEYHFDNKKVKLLAPRDGSAPDAYLGDTLVAKFSTDISSWGQFSVGVDFGDAPFNQFEIVGVDDVIFTIDSAMIDYSDTENPGGLPVSYFEDSRNKVIYNNNYLDWRGFFIKSVSVQLPQSLSIADNGNRVQFAAENIIYDRPNGLTSSFTALPEQGEAHIANGHLEGWGVSLDTVRLQVTHNSPEQFDILGGVQIPVMRESIAYVAKFNRPDPPSQGGTAKVELAFELVIADSSTFTVPFLNDATMKLANSVAGFKYLGGVLTPYANFSGSFDLGFDAGQSGADIAADFQFPGLGFQGFTLNYDYLNDAVIPQQPNTGGLGNMEIYAFEFAGTTYQSDGGGSVDEPAPEEENDDGKLVKQKVKGFPIAIKNIGFRSTGNGNDKSLDFTILLNFTKPKVGLTASASLGIVGQIDFGELLTLEPWNALSFKALQLHQILIGTKQEPVDIGGISLYGGLAVIDKHVTYGDGFKGFLVMKVKPGITVDVVGQFGTISKQDGSLDYRYWFADAKMTIKKGIKLGPAPVGVFGFGGGAYYNMTQLSFAATQLDVSLDSGNQNIPEDGSTPQISSALLQPGTGLFCSYTPRKDVFGVKAVVVLGTHPKPKTANMDLVLGIEFNTDPFGLRKVSLSGDVYFMADLNKRQSAQVKGTTSIVYNHSAKTLAIDGSVAIKLQNNIITGGGNFNLFFNLNEGQSKDWYMALGAPPIAKRMGLKFKLGTTQSIAGYFVAGNVNRLPYNKRRLPKLREYHSMLQEFENNVSLDFTQLMDGNAILMGMSYTYKVDKDYKVIGASVDFTAGFDVMISECKCAGYNPTGIDGWYLQGQIYGAMEGKLDIRVKLPFHRGRYRIATIGAAAMVDAKLPNPTWMSAHVSGKYKILKGLVKGKFKLDLEFGEKCQEVPINLNAEDLLADIKVIGATNPVDREVNIPVYREKLAVVSFLQPINGVMDFSEESDDGLMVKPYLISLTPIKGPQPTQGNWRYLNDANVNIGANGNFDRVEFVSTKLLQPLASYQFTVTVGWKKKTNDDPNWKVVYKTDNNGNSTGVKLTETATVRFTTDNRPSTLPPDAVLASYPDYRAINYCIGDNPGGGGVALKLQGWGYLFNPKKRDKEGNPCDPRILEYDYFVRIIDVASGAEAFEGALTAVPVPEWGKPVGDPVYTVQSPCQSSNPFLSWAYRFLNISCTVASQGPCAVWQPTAGTAKSNVKGMANSWNFGGTANNFDLAISQNTGLYDKSIGFPDFSHALEKGKVYRFELVAKPIVSEEEYEVTTTQIDQPTMSTEYGEYTITQTTQSIQGQFGGGAPEKIIYTSTFGTSQYNTFLEKLGSTNPAFSNANAFHLQYGQDTLFNNTWDFYQDISYYQIWNYSPTAKKKKKKKEQQAQIDAAKISGILIILMNAHTFPLYTAPPSTYDFYISHVQSYPYYRTSMWSIKSYPVNMNMSALQYSLSGVQEGFDIYELGRFSYFAKYDWDTGFTKYMNTNLPRFKHFPKETSPFDNTIIPEGPYTFINTFNSGTSLLAKGATTKSSATNISLRFYPRTSSLYRLMRIYQTSSLLKSFPYNPYYYSFDHMKRDIASIPLYNNMPADYGDLFRLKYEKGGKTANLAFNKEGGATGSYVDYSGGPYYLRNVGSGRYVARESYPKVSTINQVDNIYKKYRLTRNADGTYYLQPFNNLANYIGASGSEANNSTSAVKLTLENLTDGSIRFKLANGQVFHEHSENKFLKVGSANEKRFDYDRFTLEKTWEGPPEDLNKTFRIKGLASGRYLYNGSTHQSKAVSMEQINMGTNAHFKLRRREGGYYDITTSNGNRIHAERINNRWLYTATASNADNDAFLFKLEKVANLTYHIKNKASGEYLYENVQDNFDELQWLILSSPEPLNNDHAKFILGDKDEYVLTLTGEYFIRSQSSGRHLYIGGGELETTATERGDDIRFIFEAQQNGNFKIKSKATGHYLHLDSGINYDASQVSGVPESYFQFQLIQVSGKAFQIKCVARNEYLFEYFGYTMDGSLHQKICSFNNLIDPEYSYFLLESSYQTPPENLSGEYLIQAKNSGRYLHNGTVLTTNTQVDDETLRFILKRTREGAYEIYNKDHLQRVHIDDNGHFSTDIVNGLEKDKYLFLFHERSEGYYTIQCKSNNQFLYENFDFNFDPSHGYLKSAPNYTSGDGYFALETDYSQPPEDLSGKYLIRSSIANQEYWYEIYSSNSYLSFNSQRSHKFLLRPKLKGQVYEIWNLSTGKKVHHFSTPATTTSSGGKFPFFSMETNPLFSLGGYAGLYRSKASNLSDPSRYYFKIEKNLFNDTYSIMNVRRSRYLSREAVSTSTGLQIVLKDSSYKGYNAYFTLQKTQ